MPSTDATAIATNRSDENLIFMAWVPPLADLEVEILEGFGGAPVELRGRGRVAAARRGLALGEPHRSALADRCAIERALGLAKGLVRLVELPLFEERPPEHELRVAELDAVIDPAAHEDECASRKALGLLELAGAKLHLRE